MLLLFSNKKFNKETTYYLWIEFNEVKRRIAEIKNAGVTISYFDILI